MLRKRHVSRIRDHCECVCVYQIGERERGRARERERERERERCVCTCALIHAAIHVADCNVPSFFSFAGLSSVGCIMLIHGCFASRFVYSVTCNRWTAFSQSAATMGISTMAGRLAHSAVASGASVVVYGGFGGVMRSDVLRLTVDAPTVCNASASTEVDAACAAVQQCATCRTYANCTVCTADSGGCAWSSIGLGCQLQEGGGGSAGNSSQAGSSCGSESGFASMTWTPAHRYAAGLYATPLLFA